MRRNTMTDRGDVKRGDIYWINPSPYRGSGEHVQRSGRPGIIVSHDKLNDTGKTYEIVYLTTKPKRDCDTHVTIRSSYQTSTALCEQIQTVSDEQIGRYVGTCTQQEMETIDRCLMISLGLNYQEPAPSNVEDIFPDNTEVEELKRRLEKMTYRAEIIRKLYDELLEKTINK